MENKHQIWHGNAITRAKYNYTSLEINIMTKVFETLNYHGDADYITYSIRLSDFLSQVNLSADNLYQVKQALRTLQQKLIEFSDTENSWYSVPLISGVKISQTEDGSFIYFNIDPFIKPYLIECGKNTTRYFRESLFAIPGKNSKRIYHYCAMFKNTGICLIKIDELLHKLGLEKSSYPIAMFRERVLDIAVAEINSYSDLQISYELKKSGKRFTQIIFYIKPKMISENYRENPQFERLKKIGLAEWQAANVIKSLSTEKISQLFYQFQLNQGKITNKGGWFWKLCTTEGVPENQM